MRLSISLFDIFQGICEDGRKVLVEAKGLASTACMLGIFKLSQWLALL